MKRYYDVCPQCGANLDPSEKCDCHKIEYSINNISSSDSLIIGWDLSRANCVCALTIARHNPIDKSMTILNTFQNDEARELYSILTNNK